MTATTHALVGASLASLIPHPVLGTTIIFLSHFVLDCIPHWDVGTNWETRPKIVTAVASIADTLFGITLAYLLFSGKVPLPYLAVAIVASEFPDWMEAPWFIFFINKGVPTNTLTKGIYYMFQGIYTLESKFHTKAQLPLGGITQIVVVSILLWLAS